LFIADELPAAAEDLFFGGFPDAWVLVKTGREGFGAVDVGVDEIHGAKVGKELHLKDVEQLYGDFNFRPPPGL
jgi:hypothetical protein